MFFDEFVERIRQDQENDDRAEREKLDGVSEEVRKRSEEMLAQRAHNLSSPESIAIKLITRALSDTASSEAVSEMWCKAIPGLKKETDRTEE